MRIKMRRVGKDYMATAAKHEYGDYIVYSLLKKDPSLTIVQVRRLCSNLKDRLRGLKGKKYHARIKEIVEKRS